MKEKSASSSSLTPPEQVDLLRRAFPAERDARMGTCAWCKAPRRRHNALCRSCWASVDAYQKGHYMTMDIFDRARWILDNKPQGVKA